MDGNRDDLPELIDQLGEMREKRKEYERLEEQLAEQVKVRLNPGEEADGKKYRLKWLAFETMRLDMEAMVKELGEPFVNRFKKPTPTTRLDVRSYKAVPKPKALKQAPKAEAVAAPIQGDPAGPVLVEMERRA